MNTTDVSSRGGGAGQRRCKQQPITCLGDDSLLLLSAHVRRPEHLLQGRASAWCTRRHHPQGPRYKADFEFVLFLRMNLISLIEAIVFFVKIGDGESKKKVVLAQ